MNVGVLVFIVLILLPLIWYVGTYNGLVRLRNHCDEAWSNIDTELKRRHELIPNLARTVEGYAKHEQAVFAQLAEARARALAPHARVRDLAADEQTLSREVGQMLVVAEAYPDLKADRQFLALQRELVNTEDRIQHVRRIYNANVRDHNNRVQTVPSNLVADMGGFTLRDYFELQELSARNAPSLKFSR